MIKEKYNYMKRCKKILLIYLLCLVSLFMAGCAQVNSMIVENGDGSIDERVYISLNVEDVISSGVDISSLKLEIREVAKNEADGFRLRLNQKIYQDLNKDIDENTKSVLREYIDGVDTIIEEWTDNRLMIGIRFASVAVYKYFYNITGDNKADNKIESSFFYDKISSQSYTLYARHFELTNRLTGYFEIKYPEFVEEQPELMYTYITDMHRQHSDADYIYQVNGEYYHTWIVDSEDMQIEFYYNIANRTNWIFVCVGMTLIVGLVITVSAIVVSVFKKKKQKSTKN